MRIKWFLLPVLLLVFSVASHAQAGFTTVSATVLDPNGQLYANCTWTAQFFDPGTAGVTPLINGSVITRVYAGNCDSFAKMSVTIPDNNAIAAGSGALNTKWGFHFCYKSSPTGIGVPPCFDVPAMTITGTTQDISAIVKMYAAPIPSSGGGATPCTSLSFAIQYNNAGALGCTGVTWIGDTLLGDSSSVFKASVFSTVTANPASAGVFRLSTIDSIDWNNNAHSSNLPLAINGSDQLTFNSSILCPQASSTEQILFNFSGGCSGDSRFIFNPTLGDVVSNCGGTALNSSEGQVDVTGTTNCGTAAAYNGNPGRFVIHVPNGTGSSSWPLVLVNQNVWNATCTVGPTCSTTGNFWSHYLGDSTDQGGYYEVAMFGPNATTAPGFIMYNDATVMEIVKALQFDGDVLIPNVPSGELKLINDPNSTGALQLVGPSKNGLSNHAPTFGLPTFTSDPNITGWGSTEEAWLWENSTSHTPKFFDGTLKQSFVFTPDGAIRLPEIAAPSGTSSTEVLWGNSVNHWLEFNPNNAGTLRVGGITGVIVSGHCLEFNDTVGTIIDSGSGCGSGGTGTVTNFSVAADPIPIFTTSVSNAGTTPALSFSLSNATAHKFFMNNSGSSAAPGFQSPGEADLPATTVFTDIANTFGAHLNDFSAATIKLPVAAGATTSANGNVIYDTTNKNWHGWTNGADKVFGVWNTTPTSGDCVQASVTASVVLLVDAGAACGTGTGPTLQTNSVNNTTQTALNFTNTTGAGGINFTNPGTSIESATLASVTGGGNAVAEMTATGPQPGDYVSYNGSTVLINTTPGLTENKRACNGYTILQSDNGKQIFCTDAGAAAVTLNAPSSYTTKFYFGIMSQSTGTVTITASGNINGAGTLVLTTKNSATVLNDGSTYDARTTTGF